MIMFLPVMGLAVLAARGLDVLREAEIRKSTLFKRYILGITLLPLLIICLLGVETVAGNAIINSVVELITRPTRYEEGSQLIAQ